MIFKRYNYRIYPTKVQAQQLAQHFGAVRFIYNWGLATKKKAWEEDKVRISRFELQSQMVHRLKKELVWLNDINAQSLQASILNLDNSFKNFFKGKGYPGFKSKSGRQTYTYPQRVKVIFEQNKINLPKIGYIKCAVSQAFVGKLKTVTIIKTSTGKYFTSCLVELDIQPATKSEPVESNAMGVDLGIKHFATLSNGLKIENPRHFNKSIKSLRRACRSHDKKKRGSKNREKSRIKLARIHEKVTNQRFDFLHKTSTMLIRENQTVCIEDLNVAGMVKNHKLARHISDGAWGAFRKMLECKANWYGKNVIAIDRFAPSSKQCSCGHKNTELQLKQRSWTCSECHTTHDRDLLAAQNIVRFAFHPETINKEKLGQGMPESTPVETLAIAGH